MKFKLIPSLAFVCLLPSLLALGFWQLNRSEQKQAYLELEAQRLAAGPMAITAATEGNAEGLRYRQASVSGTYDGSHQVLIDNQILAGKPGYFVLTPLLIDGSNKAVLVNRGWVPLNKDRLKLPDVSIASKPVTLSGRINGFPSVGIKLQGAEQPTKTWPAVVQVADSKVLSEIIGHPLFGFQLELDTSQADGYVREWHTSTVMLPEQHVAYALQWFGLALTLTIMFVWYSFKKNNNDTSN